MLARNTNLNNMHLRELRYYNSTFEINDAERKFMQKNTTHILTFDCNQIVCLKFLNKKFLLICFNFFLL